MELYSPPDPAYVKNFKAEPTITVKKKGSGRIVLISPDQFNEELHEKLPDGTPVAQPPLPSGRVRSAPEPEEEPFIVSEFSESELAKMGTSELKQLPEFARVKTPWRNKQELVMAILAARLKTGDGAE